MMSLSVDIWITNVKIEDGKRMANVVMYCDD